LVRAGGPGEPGKVVAGMTALRRLDRGLHARVERPSLRDKSLTAERRSLRSALRAPVETTEIVVRETLAVRMNMKTC
jgi:hypothetical protein